jgi:hypothetical protein
VANALQDQLAEVLLDRIRRDNYPSGTHMDLLESLASPRMRVEFAFDLMQRIENDPHPSIPMIKRCQRLIGEFGN